MRQTPRQNRRDQQEDQPNLSPTRKAKATAVWFSTRGAYANRCKCIRNCDCRQLASGHRETVSLSPGKGRGDLSSKDSPLSPPQLPPAEPGAAPCIPRTAPGSLNSSRSSASPLRAFRTTTQIKANSFLLFLAHREARNNASSIHKSLLPGDGQLPGEKRTLKEPMRVNEASSSAGTKLLSTAPRHWAGAEVLQAAVTAALTAATSLQQTRCQLRRRDLEPNHSPRRHGIEGSVKEIHHLPRGQRNRVRDTSTCQLCGTTVLLFSSRRGRGFVFWVIFPRQNYLFTRSAANHIYCTLRTTDALSNTGPTEGANTKAMCQHPHTMSGEIKDLHLILLHQYNTSFH